MRRVLIFMMLFLTGLSLFSCKNGKGDSSEYGNREYTLEVKKRISDFGIVTDDPSSASKNTRAVKEAVKNSCDNTEIVFPEGVVYIDGEIRLSSKTNLRLCGSGSGTTLINTSYRPPVNTRNSDAIFRIDGCENLRIENFTIDYLYRSTCEGIITKIYGGKTYFKAFPELLVGDNAVKGGETVYSALFATDKEFTSETWPTEGITLSSEGDGIFSVKLTGGRIGDRISCRISSGSYTSPAIFVSNTCGLFLKDIACRSCPSAFIYATYGNADFVFQGIDVSVPEESQRMLASNEDCIHIKHLAGYLRITDSNFVGIGDDALNVHTKLGAVTKISESTVNIKDGRDKSSFPNGFFRVGNTVEFFNSSYKSLGRATVTKISGDSVTLDSIPEGVKAGSLVQNISFSPTVEFKSNHIAFGRARGVLLQSRTALVEGCTFENLRLSAVLACPDLEYWFEGGFTEKLEIIGNTFENCTNTVKDNGFAVIQIGTSHDALQKRDGGACHQSVTVKDNTFRLCNGKRLNATSVIELISDIK